MATMKRYPRELRDANNKTRQFLLAYFAAAMRLDYFGGAMRRRPSESVAAFERRVTRRVEQTVDTMQAEFWCSGYKIVPLSPIELAFVGGKRAR